MAAPDSAPPLEELPQAARDLARATLAAGRDLVEKSAAAFTNYKDAPTGFLAIRTSALNLRLYLGRQGERIFFFFFKQELPDVRLIETNLRIALRAVQDDGTLPPQSTECSYRLLAPPFMVPRPTADELRRYGPAQCRAEDVLLLRIGDSGQHVLGIAHPEAGASARVMFTTNTTRALSRFEAAPFLELIETLRSFIEGGKQDGQEVALALPTDPRQMNNVHLTLLYLVEGYLQIELEMLRARTTLVPPPLHFITPFYEPADYSADVALCLDRQGRFAAPDEPNPVSLNLNLRVGRESNVLVAHIALLPPDFLVSGTLRDAFLDALRDDTGTTGSLRKTLQMTTENSFADFLNSARPRCVVFRTDHAAGGDTDALVLPGTWFGRSRTLILVSEVSVSNAASSPQVKLHKVTLAYDSLTDADQALDAKTAVYFMRLAAALKDWLTVLR